MFEAPFTYFSLKLEIRPKILDSTETFIFQLNIILSAESVAVVVTRI